MTKEQKIFSFDEVVNFLQSVKSLNKEEAEFQFANFLARNGKVDLVPLEIAERLIEKSEIDFNEHLVKANFEALIERKNEEN